MSAYSEKEKEAFYNCLKNLPECISEGNYTDSKELGQIFKFFPEFEKSMTCKQHKIHAYTIGMHSLKVIEDISRNPLFKKLTKENKRTLLLTALFHDISKEEGEVDKFHPEKSAKTAASLLKRLQLPREQENTIITLIKTHNWLEIMDKSDEKDETAKKYARIFGSYEMLKMAKIFCAADLKAVNDRFFMFFGNQIEEFAPMIEKNII